MSDTSLTEFQKKKRAELEMALKQSGQSVTSTQPTHEDRQNISKQEVEDLKKGETDSSLADKPSKKSKIDDAIVTTPYVEAQSRVPEEKLVQQDESEEFAKEDFLIAGKTEERREANVQTQITNEQQINSEFQNPNTKPQDIENQLPTNNEQKVGKQTPITNNQQINTKFQDSKSIEQEVNNQSSIADEQEEDSKDEEVEGSKSQKGVSVNINLNLSPEGLKSSKELAGKSYDKVTGIFEKLISTTFKPVDEFEEYDHFVEGKFDPKYSVKLARQMLTVSVLFVFVLVIFAVVNNILGTVISITFLREICFVILMIGLSLLLYKYQKYLYLDHPYPITVMTGGILLGIISLLLLVNHFYLTFLVSAGLSAFLFYYGVTRVDKDLTKLSKQFSDPGKERNCPNCGSKIKKGENYCYNCEEYVY